MKTFLYLTLVALCCSLVGCAGHSGLDPESPAYLQAQLDRHEDRVLVQLNGADQGTTSEVFGKVLRSAPGVVKAASYGSQMTPGHPQANWNVWLVDLDGIDLFTLQTEMQEMFRAIIQAGGHLQLYGERYEYAPYQVEPLKGMRLGESTSRRSVFVVDRELLRDKEFAGE